MKLKKIVRKPQSGYLITYDGSEEMRDLLLSLDQSVFYLNNDGIFMVCEGDTPVVVEVGESFIAEGEPETQYAAGVHMRTSRLGLMCTPILEYAFTGEEKEITSISRTPR